MPSRPCADPVTLLCHPFRTAPARASRCLVQQLGQVLRVGTDEVDKLCPTTEPVGEYDIVRTLRPAQIEAINGGEQSLREQRFDRSLV